MQLIKYIRVVFKNWLLSSHPEYSPYSLPTIQLGVHVLSNPMQEAVLHMLVLALVVNLQQNSYLSFKVENPTHIRLPVVEEGQFQHQ